MNGFIDHLSSFSLLEREKKAYMWSLIRPIWQPICLPHFIQIKKVILFKHVFHIFLNNITDNVCNFFFSQA